MEFNNGERGRHFAVGAILKDKDIYRNIIIMLSDGLSGEFFCRNDCGKVKKIFHRKNPLFLSYTQSYQHYPQEHLGKKCRKRDKKIPFVEKRNGEKKTIFW